MTVGYHVPNNVGGEHVAPCWRGRTGLVHEAMLVDHPDLYGFEVYVCGSVQMVDSAVPAFLNHGLGADACFSDAFTPNMHDKSGPA